MIDLVIERTKAFFHEMGMEATKQNYGVTDEMCREIVRWFKEPFMPNSPP